MPFDEKTWANGTGVAAALLNDDSMNDLESRLADQFAVAPEIDGTPTDGETIVFDDASGLWVPTGVLVTDEELADAIADATGTAAYAAITADVVQAATAPLYTLQPDAEVAGLVISPVVPPTGILSLEFWAEGLESPTAGASIAAAIFEGATQISYQRIRSNAANLGGVVNVRAEISGLTPGATPTYKCQVGRTTGAVGVTLKAAATSKAFIKATPG